MDLFPFIKRLCVNENMDDSDIVNNLVLKFTSMMNDWEYKMYITSRVEDKKYVSIENLKIIKGCTKELLEQTYYDILKKYCTIKERKYGGHPFSYGKPTKYSGISQETILESNLAKKNQYEVVCKSDYFFDTVYKFILLKKKNQWKIDSLKVKRDEKWSIDYL